MSWAFLDECTLNSVLYSCASLKALHTWKQVYGIMGMLWNVSLKLIRLLVIHWFMKSGSLVEGENVTYS